MVAVARLRPDGSLDPSFEPGSAAGPGRRLIAVEGAHASVNAVAIGADGGIVLAGGINGGLGPSVGDFGVWRLPADGGPAAAARTELGGQEHAEALAIQPGGGIVVAGGSGGRIGLVRFSSPDAADPGFPAGGERLLDPALGTRAAQLIAAPDGALYLVGEGADFLVTRLTPSGAVDTTYAGGGSARSTSAQPTSRSRALSTGAGA